MGGARRRAGGISYLAQGADGVLWIASARGLFQFDGVRFERFEPPPGQTLLPHAPNVLLALPDTSLWIGHLTAGVSVFRRGRIPPTAPRTACRAAP